MGIGDSSLQQGYCVYMHACRCNNKVYVGITNNVKARWAGKEEAYKGCSLIYNALKKYGWDNFAHVVLHDKLTKEEACEEEKIWIALFKLTNKSYNITDGGEGTSGVVRSEKHKEALRRHRLGIKVPKEIVEKTIQTKKKIHAGCRKIYAFDINTKQLVKEYLSVVEAAKEVKLAPTNISRAAKGNRPSAAGYIWSYSPNIDVENPYYDKIGSTKAKPVFCYDLFGNYIKTYSSSSEAVKEVGGIPRGINACCSKDIVSYKHHIWRYEMCEIEPEILKKIRFKKHETNSIHRLSDKIG